MDVLINEVMYDFSSIEAHADGVHFPKIKEISYSDELSRAKVYGTGAQPVGRTRGQLKPEAAVTMYKSTWETFKLQVLGGAGFMETSHTWVVHYAEGLNLITDTILACKVNKVETSPSAGSEPVEVKLTLDTMGILWNGVAGIDNFTPIG